MPKRSSKRSGDPNVIGFLVAQVATGQVQPRRGAGTGEGAEGEGRGGSAGTAKARVPESGRESEVASGSQETQDQGKNPAAVALGRLGGLKGGKARAESLSAKKRAAIAKKAAEARWKGKAPKA